MEKSSDAFRTISEVADDLALPQHVLRFWETRFPHIKPMKRAGGRRYYRPADVVLLRTIRQLLYDEGYTIKGVQRLLKEQGARSFRAGAVPVAPIDLAELDDGEPAALLHPDPGEDLDLLPEAPLGQRTPLEDVQRDALIETLALVDECTRILESLRRPQA